MQSIAGKLTSITPIDGRYKDKTLELSKNLSEYALIKFRVEVEVKYLIALSKTSIFRKLTKREISLLESIYLTFSIKDAIKIKMLENETRHDIKAIEKFLILYFKKKALNDLSEFIHFGITSEDINNLAYRLMLKGAINDSLIKKFTEISNTLLKISKKQPTPMIARTHGQAAVPTTFEKELFVFYKRLEKEIALLKKQKMTGKLNGAVGNFNALYFAYPNINWIKFSKEFVLNFNLEPNLNTTQINSFEDIIYIFQTLQRINGILTDFCQDMWRYISDDWLKLAIKNKEVGSSTMPHKVNPIDFENAEGNLILANGLMQTMIDKLYISRLQRDLSNSTVIRNVGTVLGFCLLGYKSVLSGISRIDLNREKIFFDLNKDWSVLSEGLQTYLRSKKFKDSYNFVSSFTKGKRLNEKSWKELINSLKIPESDKQILLKLTPNNYLGLSKKLTR